MRFVIQAIQRRSDVVAYIQHHIPSAEVVWDDSGRGLGGFLKVLRHIGQDPFVLLEDDVILTKNIVPKVTQAIAQHPDNLIQFHSRSSKDRSIGSRFKGGGEFYNHQCVYFPSGMAASMLAFSNQDAFTNPASPSYRDGDLLTQAYLQHHKLKYWVSIPSLADHLPDVSAIDHKRAKRGARRQAHVFLDPELLHCPTRLASAWKPLQP